MNLSDSEKRDLCKLIEEGKMLPEKYRFVLFGESKQVELLWNGKSDEISNIILPFQIIEQIDEPRTEDIEFDQGIFDLMQGRQQTGWTNKLIWGDNKYLLSSLKNGPMRDEIEKEGGIKLVYIDPPFDTAADFSINVGVGEDNNYEKKPNVLEEIAYRDTWGLGQDSFISMMYERILLIYDLLSENGSIYIHCDPRVNAYIRLVLDEVFGKDGFGGEIIWQRSSAHNDSKRATSYGTIHDTIFWYHKGPNYNWNTQFTSYSEEYIKSSYNQKDNRGYFKTSDLTANNPGYSYSWKGAFPSKGRYWAYSEIRMKELDQDERIYYSSTGKPYLKNYANEMKGIILQDIWTDIPIASGNEKVGYPTQKPEALLERIIKSHTNEGDLICDFFAGSGTTAAVAEKLGRKWICSDLGKFAIHTTRKRMIGVQRELKKKSNNWRSFEVLNLGKYQREYFVSNDNEEQNEIHIKNKKIKINDFENLIFEAYKAKRINGFKTLHATRGDDFISLGPVNQPLSRLHIEEVISECLKNKIISVHILGFEYEMGLFPTIQQEAKERGVRLLFKHIPIDIFDKRAVKKGEVIFHDVAYIEFKCHTKNGYVSVELKDFAVFYNEDNFAIEDSLKPGKSKIVIEKGQILEKSKTKDGEFTEKILTNNWHDWIDYWSVDFNYESKKEFIKYFDESGESQEKWTGNYVFENEWQSFRTKALQNKLELKTSEKKLSGSSTKVAVKVIDIFGNDTMKVVEVDL